MNFRNSFIQGTKEKVLEYALKGICDSAILTNLHPRTSISIILQDLQSDGNVIFEFLSSQAHFEVILSLDTSRNEHAHLILTEYFNLVKCRVTEIWLCSCATKIRSTAVNNFCWNSSPNILLSLLRP